MTKFGSETLCCNGVLHNIFVYLRVNMESTAWDAWLELVVKPE